MSDWDKYFMEIADVVSHHTKCLSRRVGAVIVRDKSIISTGYNGPARGIPPCTERFKLDPDFREMAKLREADPLRFDTMCPRQALGFKSGEGLQYCLAGHAERNSLINAARLGISTYGSSLFCNCGVPCKDCLIEIINAGVMEIVCLRPTFYDVSSKYIIEHSNISLRVIKQEGL